MQSNLFEWITFKPFEFVFVLTNAFSTIHFFFVNYLMSAGEEQDNFLSISSFYTFTFSRRSYPGRLTVSTGTFSLRQVG